MRVTLLTLHAGLTIWFSAAEMKVLREIQARASQKYSGSEGSDLNWFLGMQIRRDVN